MSYYEKLIKKMSQSMKEHPRRDKMAAAVIFQKPSEKAAWIL